jgi:hypothetical protein
MTKKEKVSVVKIDSQLLKSIEELIAKDSYRFKFANKKQFIDIAVSEYLKNIIEEDDDSKK